MITSAARLTAASVCVLALSACASSHHAKQPTSPGAAPTTSTAPSGPPINPLTGGAPSPNSVVAVKIDDTASGLPQVGVNAADIVYVEQVEGGLTRLLAVFDTTLPRKVEPVRSTRVGDPDLALQFGHIVYVASGGSLGELKPLDASHLRTAIGDRGAAGFARDPHRPMPFNLTADLAAIGARLKGPKAKDIGLTWSPRLTNVGAHVAGSLRTKVGATPVGFDWDAKSHRYVRVIDGHWQRAVGGALVATPNVIVQYCQITTFLGDIDQSGSPAKVTHTVGQGKVVVFRSGRRIDGTWKRASVDDGTHLTDANGRPIPLTPGGAWFLLVADGTALS